MVFFHCFPYELDTKLGQIIF